ncbi:hypothetical protein NIES46_43250 [Arthrospira platensis NIES-46]|jgi:hypothetical protein|uniref:Uncharacterized protein n=1 Tax=Limnospira platensis NIES-46 TaxID=1236695 RepID=A0A5M3TE78_LIMPL|nr:hypothetical protein NIES46_43250 [Arthrospira platensis NIES-46]
MFADWLLSTLEVLLGYRRGRWWRWSIALIVLRTVIFGIRLSFPKAIAKDGFAAIYLPRYQIKHHIPSPPLLWVVSGSVVAHPTANGKLEHL